MAFHETQFPTDISFGSRGGPKRKTLIAVSGSGYETRNSQWTDSKRDYNAGYGIKNLDNIYTVISFFEERRGRLHGFRWKDRFDYKSSSPGSSVTNTDQSLGTGDGTTLTFQLKKTYGTINTYTRDIKKPVDGTVVIALDGVSTTTGFTVDTTTGIVSFDSTGFNLNFENDVYVFGNPPASGVVVTAGFEFDVPVRFDTDNLQIDLSAFDAGQIPDIPIVEVRL